MKREYMRKVLKKLLHKMETQEFAEIYKIQIIIINKRKSYGIHIVRLRESVSC